jgi:hypothetical protein
MQAAKDVVDRLKDLKINALHVKLRGRGGKYLFKLIYIKGVDTR